MNYSVESLRKGYQDNLKKEAEKVDDDVLRKLGYSETSIRNRTA